MKKLVMFILLVAVFSSFSPFAVAMDLLDKPSAGQVIFMEADNDLDYKADFPLSALTGAFRDGDDLRLEFPAARLTLKGFFTPMGEWRGIVFSDGSSIGGADFDDEGAYTGSFHSVLDKSKSGQSAKSDAKAPVVTVRISPYGTEVRAGNEETWGELRNTAIQAASLISPFERPDWNIILEQRFEFFLSKDGSLSPLRLYTDFADGISAELINPQRIYLSESLNLLPLSEGRATVIFSNRRGEMLLKEDVLCLKDESGTLYFECECAGCGGTQSGTLHYLPCGHFSCSEDFDAALHDVAPCQVAGHCVSESEHEKCSNCLEYICDGMAHGPGLCEHVHNWVAVTLVSSRCTGCGYVYTRK